LRKTAAFDPYFQFHDERNGKNTRSETHKHKKKSKKLKV
jgi:hypothetical protein